MKILIILIVIVVLNEKVCLFYININLLNVKNILFLFLIL